MVFSAFIGNEIAKTALMRMVTYNTLPHTLLFCGPDGVGKGLFAAQLAALLMGPNAHGKLTSGNHPDLYLLSPEGKAGIHPIENIRSLIAEASLPPFEAPVKVFIIRDAHCMPLASSNAFLKTLEEPPLHAYFILLTSQCDAILPTIASRCRKIAFFPIPEKEIEAFVHKHWNKSIKEAERIALLSHGSLAKAHTLAYPKCDVSSSVRSLVHLSLPHDYAHLLALCEALDQGEESKTCQDALLEEIGIWYRDFTLLNCGIERTYLYNSEAMPKKVPSLEIVLKELLIVQAALQCHIKFRFALERFFVKMEQHVCLS